MDKKVFWDEILLPGLELVEKLSSLPSTPRARVFSGAICLQESGLSERRQLSSGGWSHYGPGRGWSQFELSGVNGVLKHPASQKEVQKLCNWLEIPCDSASIYEAIAWNDLLSIGLTRLLFYTDRAPLPPLGASNAAWEYYLRVWRPGKPDLERWEESYKTSLEMETP